MRGGDAFEEFDDLDRVGEGGAFLERLEHDQVAVGGIFVGDERLPVRRWVR